MTCADQVRALPSAPRRRGGYGLMALAGLALLLAGCASTKYRPVSDTPVRIGKPYAVRGVTYTPADDRAYDRLGYASWYGDESEIGRAHV